MNGTRRNDLAHILAVIGTKQCRKHSSKSAWLPDRTARSWWRRQSHHGAHDDHFGTTQTPSAGATSATSGGWIRRWMTCWRSSKGRPNHESNRSEGWTCRSAQPGNLSQPNVRCLLLGGDRHQGLGRTRLRPDRWFDRPTNRAALPTTAPDGKKWSLSAPPYH